MPGGHTRTFTDSREILKVTEYLGGEIVQRRHMRRKVTEDFVELCQEGIEQVQVCHSQSF
jgi:hypothetical protein